MQDDAPVSETIRTLVVIHITMLSRSTIRDFAGYQLGKRRKLTMLPHIAKEMAQRLLVPVAFWEGERSVAADEIAGKIEPIFRSCSDEDAFRFVSPDREEVEFARNDLTISIVDTLLSSFTATRIDNSKGMITASISNGWKLWERIYPGERPKYRWRRAWAPGVGGDFVGFDGEFALGRVFRIEHIPISDKWFWLLGHVDGRPELDMPFSGWENTPREAACRVEWCYERMQKPSDRRAGAA